MSSPNAPSSSSSPLQRKKRSYSELKITGPPLYGQGSLSENADPNFSLSPATLPLDPRRTALLIVDVQPEYWSECPAVREDFPNFPSNLSSLVSHCRAQQSKCIWVRADYSFDKSPWLQQFSRLHRGRIPPVVKPNSKWEKFATPEESEFVMTKTSWSSTSDTNLITVLKDSGIDTVLVCGLITSVCVQHSAFGIFEAGFRTVLVADACADRGKARHDAALALYSDYMYSVMSVERVKEKLNSSTSTTHNMNSSSEMIKTIDGNTSMSTIQTSQLSESEASESEEELCVIKRKAARHQFEDYVIGGY